MDPKGVKFEGIVWVSESIKYIKALERKVKFIGYILRCNKFVTNIIESKVPGKRGGKSWKPYIEDIEHHMHISKYSHRREKL